MGNKSSFVFVDAEREIRKPAFDHDKLAEALRAKKFEADADNLPFTWIEFGDEEKFVKFSIDGHKWEFSQDGNLTEHDGDIDDGKLTPLDKEVPSQQNSTPTIITFINKTDGPISLFWIDWNGNATHYVTFPANSTDRRSTFMGHVWRVTKAETNEPIASYMARARESVALIESGAKDVTELFEKATIEKDQPEVKVERNGTKATAHAFVKDNNVFYSDSDGQETQLSTNGSKEEPYSSNVHHSPNGQFAVAYQYTPEQDHKIFRVQSSPKDQVQPKLQEQQYLKPGDKVRVDRPRIFDFTNKSEVVTEDMLFQNPYSIQDVGWNASGDEYRFLYNQRGHQVLRILGMNKSGHVRTIIEEVSNTFIDYSQKLYFFQMRDSKELIWASERDGRNHLYLYDLDTGDVKAQITRGEWNVHEVEEVDEDRRQILFTAIGLVQGPDPYYLNLVRVNFDGSDFTLLTGGIGTHDTKFSPDKKYIIDTMSQVDIAPQIVLRDAGAGRQIVELESSNLESLSQVGWTTPEIFAAPGRDGKTMIYGIIIKPSQMEEGIKYPVVEEIYAGPQDFTVPKSFSTLQRQHEIAELGFVVVMIDGMGTNWRWKEFQDVCFKNLKDAGLPDRIAWIKAAAVERPWMDLDNVGIYGGSAGGQNAMAALLWHGDFYKAAVADSGCHDNRMDKIWWNEQWMGWPVDQSYEDSSNVVHAGKLKGALMLIVGELDDNVDPASTMQVVNALNEAGKDYDLLFVPGGGHGIGFGSYGLRRLRDFFVKHLMGVEPPKRNNQ